MGHTIFWRIVLYSGGAEHHDAPESPETLYRYPVPLAVDEVTSDNVIIDDNALTESFQVGPHEAVDFPSDVVLGGSGIEGGTVGITYSLTQIQGDRRIIRGYLKAFRQPGLDITVFIDSNQRLDGQEGNHGITWSG